MNEHLDESSEGFGEVNSAIRPVTQQKVQLFKAFLKGSVLEGMHDPGWDWKVEVGRKVVTCEMTLSRV